jgi:hypothetical protein
MNIAQSLMAGAGRSDPLMRPGGTTELRGMPSQSSVPPGRGEGGGFRFPAMHHWATLRSPSGARHLQNALSDYLFKIHIYVVLKKSVRIRVICVIRVL